MSANPSRLICLVALGLCLGHGAAQTPPDGTKQTAADVVVAPILSTAEQAPADFLDMVGRHTKARWRLLFRPPPPTPPTDRGRAALILGSLLGDSFLIWQAADPQQFRNNNQDVLTYCRMLGLGEKLMPRLMAQGKMAESNEWKAMRREIVDGHQELVRLLREQKDDDLALMIDLGLWLRVLEIVSTIVADTPAADLRPIGLGSLARLQDLRDDLSHLSAPKREEGIIQRIGATLGEVSTTWQDVDKTPPTPSQLANAHAKLKELMQALMAK